MLERFRRIEGIRRTERELQTNLPDVKFFGFGHRDFPYRVGFDIDGYKDLLQNSLGIPAKDTSRIVLRFGGVVRPEEQKGIEEDQVFLNNNSQNDALFRVISVGEELLVLYHMTGIPPDQFQKQTHPGDMEHLISHLLAAKLLMESISIKDELMHQQLLKKPSVRAQRLLHSKILGFSSIGAAEYIFRDVPWSLRALVLAEGFLTVKLLQGDTDMRVRNKINSLHQATYDEVCTMLGDDKEQALAPEIQQQWTKLISVHPVSDSQ